MLSGLRAVEICGIHHECLRRIGIEPGGGALGGAHPSAPPLDRPAETISAAGVFFAAALAAFESQDRELRQTNIASRQRIERFERDQRRVSDLIYSEALQLVAALRMALAGSPAPPPAAVPDILDRLEDQLAACVEGLRPRVLEDLGLASALRSLSRRFASASSLDVTTEAVVGPLSPAVSLALYGAVLEALTNAHRHARAKTVNIRLFEDCSVIYCSIRDDGIGFDMSKTLSNGGIRGSGFASMRESLGAVGGTLTVDSVPGQGTELRISICPRMQD